MERGAAERQNAWRRVRRVNVMAMTFFDWLVRGYEPLLVDVDVALHKTNAHTQPPEILSARPHVHSPTLLLPTTPPQLHEHTCTHPSRCYTSCLACQATFVQE